MNWFKSTLRTLLIFFIILILAFLIRYGLVNIEIAIEMIRTKIIDAFKPKLEYENAIKIFSEEVKK